MNINTPVKCQSSAIDRLTQLASKLGNESALSRIEFASLVFKFNLYQEVTSHQLHDLGVQSRDLDTCFEMSDGKLVVHGVMAEAINNEDMETAIRHAGMWDSWKKTYWDHERFF